MMLLCTQKAATIMFTNTVDRAVLMAWKSNVGTTEYTSIKT